MTIVTPQSIELRKKQADELRAQISAVKEDVADARSQGDLSENFGYTEGRKVKENLERRLAALDAATSGVGIQIVNPKEWLNIDMDGVPRAMVGAKIQIERDGVPETFLIGGAWDDFPNVVAYTSPLAKALIPKQPGFETEFEVDGLIQKIRLVSAEAPSSKDIAAFYPEKKKAGPPVSKKEEVTLDIE